MSVTADRPCVLRGVLHEPILWLVQKHSAGTFARGCFSPYMQWAQFSDRLLPQFVFYPLTCFRLSSTCCSISPSLKDFYRPPRSIAQFPTSASRSQLIKVAAHLLLVCGQWTSHHSVRDLSSQYHCQEYIRHPVSCWAFFRTCQSIPVLLWKNRCQLTKPVRAQTSSAGIRATSLVIVYLCPIPRIS